jgi:hypothetical protein
MGVRTGPYGREEIGASDPGSSLILVAPHATDPLPDGTSRALWITVEGNISVICENDTDPITIPVERGLFPFRVKAVRVAGTTATAYAVY